MTLRIRKIPHHQNGDYTVYESSDFEYTDPVKHFRDVHLKVEFEFAKKYLLSIFPKFPAYLIEFESQRQALIEWEKSYKNYLNLELPKNFFELLNSDSKKEQIHLLKGQSITSDQLTALIIKAFINSEFTLSQYSASHYPQDIDPNDLPLITEIDNDDVIKIGKTSLSDSQLKHVVKFRNVTISKFLDNKKSWHCFFLTFKSIFGEESWHDGMPHVHYISDKFGLPRDKVVRELKNKNYKLGNLPHIIFNRYK